MATLPSEMECIVALRWLGQRTPTATVDVTLLLTVGPMPNCRSFVLITCFVFYAIHYNKMWCFVQQQTIIVVLCKIFPNSWC
jgi:hypothetical protein